MGNWVLIFLAKMFKGMILAIALSGVAASINGLMRWESWRYSLKYWVGGAFLVFSCLGVMQNSLHLKVDIFALILLLVIALNNRKIRAWIKIKTEFILDKTIQKLKKDVKEKKEM